MSNELQDNSAYGMNYSQLILNMPAKHNDWGGIRKNSVATSKAPTARVRPKKSSRKSQSRYYK